MLLFALLLVSAVAAPFNAQYWRKDVRAAPKTVHSVVIAPKLVANAAANCDSLLMRVSLPDSPEWGQHLSFEEAGQMFRNVAAETRAKQWLRASGISDKEMRVSPHGEFIRVTTTVDKLERLLGARFHHYVDAANPAIRIVRDLDWQMPQRLGLFLDFVSDTRSLPVPRHIARKAIHVSRDTVGKRQSGSVTPQLLQSVYRITLKQPASAQATQSLFESLGQSFSPSDLQSFQQQYNLPTTEVANVIGPNQPSQCAADPNNCAEANLDVQYILGIAQNATTWFWSTSSEGDIFLEWIEAVASTPNAPLIHSVSYGSLAPEDPQTDIERFNTEMCKLGLKGLTLFVASGDDGVANFGARGNPSQCGFTPSFPATSPYSTSVGATQGPESGQPEIACSSETGGIVTTGGGFSTYVKRPDWQDTAVHAYLNNPANKVPPRSMFSSQGRAYPDIAGLGYNYNVFIGGQSYGVSGTSASTPMTAGMFTLINGARLKLGKSPVGYLNPILYQLGGNNSIIFNDITSGENNCCAGQQGQQTCCQYGFYASSAWDPLTGWGSLKFDKLLAYFVSLP